MTLQSGTRLGPYEITAPLGAGGMGEVYRAVDSRLRREVAVKVLPGDAPGDPDRIARFEREARAVAGLSHPNIPVVHDVGEADGQPYLVSELLEGESLRERLDRGPIDWSEAVSIVAEVAEGLAAAHDAGVVHRDLKPGNLFLTRDGRVKILDFGLAKLRPGPNLGAAGEADATTPLQTREGAILGTVGYLSPEQVRGQPADPRSDLFALGGVLYEMVWGRRAFVGPSSVDVLSAILNETPSTDLPEPSVPSSVRRIVERCLAKERSHRFQAAADLAFHLRTVIDLPSDEPVLGDDATARVARGLSPWKAGIGVVAALVAGWWLATRLDTEAPSSSSATGSVPMFAPLSSSGRDSLPAISPDGRTLAFVSSRDGEEAIWLMRLPSGDETRLTEMEGTFPRFSGDGSYVIFTGQDGIYRVPVLGGAPRRLVEGAMADWSPVGDQIVVARREGPVERLVLTDAEGAEPVVLLELSDQAFLPPRFDPSGRRVAAPVVSPGSNVLRPQFVVIDLDSSEVSWLDGYEGGGTIFSVDWTPDGSSVVLVQPEDHSPARGRSQLVVHPLDGPPRVLARAQGTLVAVDIVADGRVVVSAQVNRAALVEHGLAPDSATPARHLTPGATFDRQPVHSPDGDWVLFSTGRGGNIDIWAVSTRSGELRRVTDHPATDWDPSITPDGRLLFTSNRSGNFEIWSSELDGTGVRQVTHDGANAENASMTPGGWIVYHSGDPEGAGIWRAAHDGAEPELLVPGLNGIPEASPAGEWSVFLEPHLALQASQIRVVSVATGEIEPFTASASGVGAPRNLVPGRSRWRPDGSGILFVGVDDRGSIGLRTADFVAGAAAGPVRDVPLPGIEGIVESFSISPDGERVVVSVFRLEETILELEGVDLDP